MQNETELRLVLLRHEVPEDPKLNEDGSPAPDSRRELTSEGIANMAASAPGLVQALNNDITLILTSPYIRARQTAELLLKAVSQSDDSKLVDSDLLLPGVQLDALEAELKNHTGTVVLIGHEPDMSHILEYFASPAAKIQVKFGKGGACMIYFRNGAAKASGELHWLLTSGMLQTLGSS